MKKYLILSSIILIISSICIISYTILESKQEIAYEKNILKEQLKKQQYLTPYGYSIEEANIILDPYDISPLTALILFETDKNESIKVTIKGKDELTTITNTFNDSKKHYIPIYGLYPNEENEVILETNTKKVTYRIKTESLPSELTIEPIVNDTNNMTFINNNGYLYAQDKNNDIRWYLKGEYKYDIIKLQNGNFLIPTRELNNEGYPIGVMELDLLGKIYKQYNLENGYHGKIIENQNSYYILSKDLIELDKQTGYIINKVKLKEEYEEISYNKTNNIINLLTKTKTLSIDLTTKETITTKESNQIYEKETNSKLYTSTNNYQIFENILFNLTEQTPKSKEKIFLLGYKKIDKTYKDLNIKISKNDNYIKIEGNFNNKETYLILDKFLDKRIYKINNNYTIINSTGLKGKYNLYLKIDDTLYNLNKYINY